MSLSKLNLGGRPKTSGVWEYFKFNIDTGFSQCVVQVETLTRVVENLAVAIRQI